jgi:hypothetical protein
MDHHHTYCPYWQTHRLNLFVCASDPHGNPLASCGNFFDFLLTQLSIHGFSGLKIAISVEKNQSVVGVILSHAIKS